MTDWTQFLKVNGEPAIKNLTIFITIATGSFVVAYMALADRLTYDIFGIYMFAGGGVYGWAMQQGEATRRSQITADATPAQNTTTINQPEKVNMGPTDSVTVKRTKK